MNLSSRPSGAVLGTLASAVALGGLAIVNSANARRAERRNVIGGGFVEVDGVKLHYLDRGEGASIVLLHGNGSMIQDWLISGLLDRLAQTNRVIAFDRPGFGYSDRPRSTIWTPEAQADLFAKAFAQLQIERPVVVGHSFGTQVTVALALNHAEAISRIVLLSGYYYPTARLDVVLGSGPAVPLLGDVMRYTVSPPFGKAMEPTVNRKLFTPAEVTQLWKDQYPSDMALRPAQIRATAAEAALMVPAAARLSKRYGELTLPITIIAGDGDLVVNTQRQSAKLHQELTHSELVVVAGAGHMVHHTALEPVYEAISTNSTADLNDRAAA